MNKKSDTRRHRIDDVLDVSVLLRTLFAKLDIITVGDLLALDVNSMRSVKGVGISRFSVIYDAIWQARVYDGLNQVKSRELTFIPSRLRKHFRQHGINQTSDLFKLNLTKLEQQSGWRELETSICFALQRFYATLDLAVPGAFIGDIVPAVLLPNPRIGKLRVRELMTKRVSLSNFSKAKTRDYLALKDLIGSVLASNCVGVHLKNARLAKLDWQEVPLRLSKRSMDFLQYNKIDTLGQLDQLTSLGYCSNSEGVLIFINGRKKIRVGSVKKLRQELILIRDKGLKEYRFGNAGAPKTAEALVSALPNRLDERGFDALSLRAEGVTLREVGERYGYTRERARQLIDQSIEQTSHFRPIAQRFVEPLIEAIKSEVLVPLEKACEILKVSQPSTVRMLMMVAGCKYEIHNDTIRLLDSSQCLALNSLLRKQFRNQNLTHKNSKIKIKNLLEKAPQKYVELLEPIVKLGVTSFSVAMVCRLIGYSWFIGHVRSQLVSAGSKGLFFEEIDTFGCIESESDLVELLADVEDVLPDGRFRRKGDPYSRGDEIVGILLASDQPKTTPELMKLSTQDWHGRQMVGNYLTPSYEFLRVSRGHYTHASHLNLNVRDVKQIIDWGVEVLRRRKKPVEVEKMLNLFERSNLGLQVESPFLLGSIIAKHPMVKRSPNDGILIHKDFIEGIWF